MEIRNQFTLDRAFFFKNSNVIARFPSDMYPDYDCGLMLFQYYEKAKAVLQPAI